MNYQTGASEEASFTFLLVEDNDDHAQLVQLALQRCGVGATTRRVNDGAEAIAYLRGEAPYQDQRRPDLVLLDLNLPKVDGIEVLRHIKDDAALRSIPTIMMTSSDAETDRLLAYNSHVNSYVLKPLDPVQFRKLLEDLSCYWGRWNCSIPAQ